jgi:steroid delta-isomerase-like uncharacterized protein
MLTDDAKNRVLEYIEAVWNRGDLAALEELTTPDFIYHLGGQPALNREGMSHFITITRAAFPDWLVKSIVVVAEGGTVVVRWTGEATHLGSFHGIPASGQKIFVCGINLYELTGDKIAAEWEQMDSLGMLRQLGVLSI